MPRVASRIVDGGPGRPTRCSPGCGRSGSVVVTLEEPAYPGPPRVRGRCRRHVLFVTGDPAAALGRERAVAVVGHAPADRGMAEPWPAGSRGPWSRPTRRSCPGWPSASMAPRTRRPSGPAARRSRSSAAATPWSDRERMTAWRRRSSASGGAVVSELRRRTSSRRRGTFPRRNRIISGLSSTRRSSSRPRPAAARSSRPRGRSSRAATCFVVPGPLDAPASAGCLALPARVRRTRGPHRGRRPPAHRRPRVRPVAGRPAGRSTPSPRSPRRIRSGAVEGDGRRRAPRPAAHRRRARGHHRPARRDRPGHADPARAARRSSSGVHGRYQPGRRAAGRARPSDAAVSHGAVGPGCPARRRQCYPRGASAPQRGRTGRPTPIPAAARPRSRDHVLRKLRPRAPRRPGPRRRLRRHRSCGRPGSCACERGDRTRGRHRARGHRRSSGPRRRPPPPPTDIVPLTQAAFRTVDRDRRRARCRGHDRVQRRRWTAPRSRPRSTVTAADAGRAALERRRHVVTVVPSRALGAPARTTRSPSRPGALAVTGRPLTDARPGPLPDPRAVDRPSSPPPSRSASGSAVDTALHASRSTSPSIRPALDRRHPARPAGAGHGRRSSRPSTACRGFTFTPLRSRSWRTRATSSRRRRPRRGRRRGRAGSRSPSDDRRRPEVVRFRPADRPAGRGPRSGHLGPLHPADGPRLDEEGLQGHATASRSTARSPSPRTTRSSSSIRSRTSPYDTQIVATVATTARSADGAPARRGRPQIAFRTVLKPNPRSRPADQLVGRRAAARRQLRRRLGRLAAAGRRSSATTSA